HHAPVADRDPPQWLVAERAAAAPEFTWPLEMTRATRSYTRGRVNLGAPRMTNFLRKLMFWRKPTDGEASDPVPGGATNDDQSAAQEELDHEAERREEYFEERRRDDEFQRGGRSREDEYLQERDEGE